MTDNSSCNTDKHGDSHSQTTYRDNINRKYSRRFILSSWPRAGLATIPVDDQPAICDDHTYIHGMEQLEVFAQLTTGHPINKPYVSLPYKI